MLARTSLDTPQSCHEIHLTSTHASFVRLLRYFSSNSSARREGSTTYTEYFNDVLSSPLVLSVFFLHSGSRVFGPKTEHDRESFFWVADLVYAASDSARSERKKARPKYPVVNLVDVLILSLRQYSFSRGSTSMLILFTALHLLFQRSDRELVKMSSALAHFNLSTG